MKEKVKKQTEELLDILGDKLFKKAFAAMNNNTIIIGSNGHFYFFDLETGKRYPDVIKVPTVDVGYHRATNTFWYFKEDDDNNEDDYDLKSFKIDGFMATPIHQPQNRELTQNQKYSRDRAYKMLENLSVTEQTPQDKMKSFALSLYKETVTEQSMKSPVTNKSITDSCHLLAYILTEG